MSGPRVRKLEWIHCADGTWHDAHCQYELETDGGYWRVTRGVTGGTSYLCDTATIEAAKAAAQADFEARILAALEIAPDAPPNGGPAYPVMWEYADNETGMSLRDWFAGQALVGISANPTWDANGWADRARSAYAAADAMIAARGGE